MELTLVLVSVFLILWWQLPPRILKVLKPVNTSYAVLLQKKIILSQKVTQEDPWWINLVLNGYTFIFNKKMNLSFAPQIGFSVSELIDLSEDENPCDRIEFLSGKIENINWNNHLKKFECEVAPQEIHAKEELGSALVNCMVEGWMLDDRPSSVSIAESAVKTFLTKLKTKIENIEKENQESLWEHLEKVQKILGMQENLSKHIFEYEQQT